MPRFKFYHRCPAVLLLAGLLNIAPGATAAVDSEIAVKLPPRSINDITRMLSDYRQHDDLVRQKTAAADAAPPEAGDNRQLFSFYWQRGLAAGELGRVPQQIADLRLAARYGQAGSAEQARLLRDLAIAEFSGGNFLNALRDVDESIRHIPDSSRGQFTGAYAVVVALASQVGDFDKAAEGLRLLDATLTTLRSGRAWPIWSHFWLANYERARGDYFRMGGKQVEAEGAYRKALREIEAAQADLPALRSAGQDAPTPETMQRMAETVERGLALSVLSQGRIVEAEATARNSLVRTLKRTGRDSPDAARGLRVLASVLGEQGRHAESAILAEAAVDAMLRSGAATDSLPLVNARQGALAAQVALGDDRRALEIYESIRRDVSGKPELAATVLRGDLDVVLAWLRTGEAQSAEKMAAEMLDYARRHFGGESLRTAEILSFHAMALADLGRQEEALAEFRKAIPPLMDRVRNDSEAETAGANRQRRLVVVIERYIALLAAMQGRLPPGLNAANEAFLLADFARGSSVQRALTRSAARAAIHDPALAELARREQDAQRRANSLNDLLTQLLAAPPDQQLPAIQARIRTDIDTLKATRAQLKQEIGRKFPDYAQLVDPSPVGLAETARLLRPGEVLLSWYFGRTGAFVWALRADGRQRFAALSMDRRGMAGAVASLRKALNPDVATIDQIPPFDVGAAHRLYQSLLAPVGDLMDGAEVLLAVPHAELGQLPLALLVSQPVAQPPAAAGQLPFSGYRNVPWLMRQLAVAQLPSVTALASLRRLPPGNSGRLPFIGFGDPYFSEEQAAQGEKAAGATAVAMRGVPLRLRSVPRTQAVDSAELALLPRLPDTAEEIREIARTLGAVPERDVFLQRAASEKTVFSAQLATRRVVMFATHGLVPGELDGLGEPALALSAPKVAGGEGDGLLTQEEILSLKLDADWVVLSACNTASSDGNGSEAVSGLGRAFFYAGARALLVSNWPVETEASRSLMTELFRRQAASPSLVKAEALRQAMATMVDMPGKVDPKTGKVIFSYAHPLFWAPFVLVGD